MSLTTLIYILIVIVILFLGISVLMRGKHRKINRTFFYFILTGLGWIISLYFYYYIENIKFLLSVGRINFGFAVAIPYFLFIFIYQFVGNYNKKINVILSVETILLFFLTIFTPLVIKNEVINVTEKVTEFGIIYFIFAIHFVLYCLFSFILLLLKYHKSSGIQKLRIKWLTFGILTTMFLASVTNIFLPYLFSYYKLQKFAPIFSIILFSSLAYAITRYRLMDIRLVIVRSIAFATIILIITGFYAALSASLGRFLEAFIGTKSDLLVGLIVAFAIAIGYSPIKKMVERATNAFLFKKTYNPDDVITEITEVSASILDLKNMLASMAQTLEDAMHPNGIAFNLLDKQEKLQVTYEHGFGDTIREITKGKEKVLPTYFKDSKQIYVIEELKTAYEQGEYKPKNKDLLYALYEADIALIVPLFTKEKLIGIIAIGNKKSGDLYTKQDLHVLNLISGQAAVGIENALLYQEQKLFGVKLEKTVKERTAELRKANIQLEELDEAKSEFISIASHQLRTPLTVIKGYISMILEGSFGKTSKVISENLKKVYSSNERLIGLVEDLLNISRIESGRQEYNFQPINLAELGTTVYDELVQKAKDKGLKLNFTKPSKTLPKVVADSDKLHEVMINFTDNSVKYTPKGKVDMSIYQKDDNLIFAVKDTGIGMNEDDKGHLFKKFSRAEGTFLIHTEGTGLGLYVAKMIAESHMGKVWAESEGRGKGSTFYMAIPIQGKGQKVGVTKQQRIKSLDVRAEATKSEIPEKKG